MTTIDASGNAHRPAGAPAGGQFAGKVNSGPAGSLADVDGAGADRSGGPKLTAPQKALLALIESDGHHTWFTDGDGTLRRYNPGLLVTGSEVRTAEALERRRLITTRWQGPTQRWCFPIEKSDAPRARRGASLNRGSFGAFGLSSVRTMRGHEGEAFSGTLTMDGKAVGEVIQDGNGGATYARFGSAQARDAFAQLVRDEWDFDQEHDWGHGDVLKVPHTQETVLDALFMENDTRRRLDRGRKAGKLAVLLPADLVEVDQVDGVQSYREVRGGVGQEGSVAADLKRRGELDGAMFWNGEEWVAFGS